MPKRPGLGKMKRPSEPQAQEDQPTAQDHQETHETPAMETQDPQPDSEGDDQEGAEGQSQHDKKTPLVWMTYQGEVLMAKWLREYPILYNNKKEYRDTNKKNAIWATQGQLIRFSTYQQWGFTVEFSGSVSGLREKLAQLLAISQPKEASSWFQSRQATMESSSHKKVLLFCYMRGGSSLFGNYFMNHEDILYWYEAIAPFYSSHYGMHTWSLPQDIFWHSNGYIISRREIPVTESAALTHYNHDLLACNTSAMPVELVSHRGLHMAGMDTMWDCIMNKSNNVGLDKCLDVNLACGVLAQAISHNCAAYINSARAAVRNPLLMDNRDDLVRTGADYIKHEHCRMHYFKNYVAPCINIIQNRCRESKLIVYKGLRLRMKQVQAFLEKDPDMYVLYLVRDPRSIVSSRFKINLSGRLFNKDPVSEAKYLCKKMLSDLEEYKAISRVYKGALKLVMYEDLMANPPKVVTDIFNFLDYDMPLSMETRLRTQTSEFIGGQLNKWKENLNANVHVNISDTCREILKAFNYPLS